MVTPVFLCSNLRVFSDILHKIQNKIQIVLQ